MRMYVKVEELDRVTSEAGVYHYIHSPYYSFRWGGWVQDNMGEFCIVDVTINDEDGTWGIGSMEPICMIPVGNIYGTG